MSNVKRDLLRKRGVQTAAGSTALLLTVGVAILWDSTAQAAAPDNLAVFFAASQATPASVVSRVPAETAGGYLLSQSSVQIGKSQALAAGFTLGPLGDAFVVTSAPPGTITQMPSVITAQDPPSETAPREASLSGGNGGGPSVGGEVRNADLNARASDSPNAVANASGQSVTTAVYTAGAGVSHSESAVLPDGTVQTKATTSVQNVLIGGPTGLKIASVDSLATITIAPGQKPITSLQVHTSGASLAGVPVIIDKNGLRISDQIPLPASSVAAFNQGLAGLAAQGLTFIASTETSKVSEGQAELYGAAFTFRYQLPESDIERPSDIGSDETFEYGKVFASVTSRALGSLGGGPELTPTTTDSAAVPGATVPGATGTDLAGTADLGALPSTVGTIPTVGLGAAAPAAAVPVGFTLTRPSLAPDQFKDGYRFLLLAAALGVAGLVTIIRKRPIA
ncbi:hypothetical protein [Sporichthya sp.]|uniref:hypothetical protein n=1 Tax=Sporichthya sp. TaxID=65475 RepID=UPI0017996DCB|nr:hypothetical protein [Sporichthya sp.]MBA3744462.1 hypothetical protein [Sporichthya sp.]